MEQASSRKGPSLRAIIADIDQTLNRSLRQTLRRNRRKIAGHRVKNSRQANALLAEIVAANGPSLVSRLGTTEGELLRYFLEESDNGECSFPEVLKKNMRTNSGFFPESDILLSQFCRETLEHLEEIDVLGVRAQKEERAFWELEEHIVSRTMANPTVVEIEDLSPFASSTPWTSSLKGKKVLVIHPFADTIQAQFELRSKLFSNPDFLPEFQLCLIKAVQSAGDNQSQVPFKTWFEALDYMRNQIASVDFDVALIGAGAYGLFLGATCKELGKTAIHIGGATQLLFGIYGRRWIEDRNSSSATLRSQINDFWTTASESEIPRNERSVEGGGYWV